MRAQHLSSGVRLRFGEQLVTTRPGAGAAAAPGPPQLQQDRNGDHADQQLMAWA